MTSPPCTSSGTRSTGRYPTGSATAKIYTALIVHTPSSRSWRVLGQLERASQPARRFTASPMTCPLCPPRGVDLRYAARTCTRTCSASGRRRRWWSCTAATRRRASWPSRPARSWASASAPSWRRRGTRGGEADDTWRDAWFDRGTRWSPPHPVCRSPRGVRR